MTGKEDWYRQEKKRKRDEFDWEENERKNKKVKKEERQAEREGGKRAPVSVMFVPYTHGGELAKRLREAEEKLEEQTGVKIKIVEKVGTKLVDLLHKADPWQGMDCGRKGCLLCQTKMKTEKYGKQD